jgi:hypothetical protein
MHGGPGRVGVDPGNLLSCMRLHAKVRVGAWHASCLTPLTRARERAGSDHCIVEGAP